MSSQTYGQKCHRCACLEHHRRGRPAEPIPWLSERMTGLPLRCPDCAECQANALAEMLMEVGANIFDPETRAIAAAVRNGEHHPCLDRLRVECLALNAVVDVAGESWFVADAQFDDAEVGAHLHLTLTRVGSDPSPSDGPSLAESRPLRPE